MTLLVAGSEDCTDVNVHQAEDLCSVVRLFICGLKKNIFLWSIKSDMDPLSIITFIIDAKEPPIL